MFRNTPTLKLSSRVCNTRKLSFKDDVCMMPYCDVQSKFK